MVEARVGEAEGEAVVSQFIIRVRVRTATMHQSIFMQRPVRLNSYLARVAAARTTLNWHLLLQMARKRRV